MTHAELVAAATDLLTQLLAVDDCWVQDAGALADLVVDLAAAESGAWLANPTLASGPGAGVPVAGGRGPVRFRGAIGGAPLQVGGIDHALMVYTRAARAWTVEDRQVLVDAAGVLAGSLEATLSSQLTPDQRARRRYDELRHELLTILNHELRTPLMTLTAGVEMLQDLDEVPAAVSAIATRMEHSVRRLIALTANVTVLGDLATAQSRLDTGTFVPPVVVDLVRDSLISLPDHVRQRVRLHPVEPETRGQTGPETGRVTRPGEGSARREDIRVAMPADSLRELLDRVVDNALKFTGPDTSHAGTGGPTDPQRAIDIQVRARSSTVTITVRDHGIGVPTHEHHGLGQPFFRATNAREQETQGAGLGLAAAVTIARRWGGTIDIDSTEGHGTTIQIRLPRAELPRADPTRAELPQADPPPVVLTEATGRPLTDPGHDLPPVLPPNC